MIQRKVSNSKIIYFKGFNTCFIVCLCFALFSKAAVAQNSLSLISEDVDSLFKYSRELYKKEEFQKLIDFTKDVDQLIPYRTEDSVKIASIYNYKQSSFYALGDLSKSITSANKGLNICPLTDSTSTFRANLFYDKAITERDSDFSLKSYTSATESLKILESQKPLKTEALIDVYLFLSSEEAYYGKLEEAERFIRLANEYYQRNKNRLDASRKLDFGENFRYDIVLMYRKVYLLYSLGTTKNDSLALELELSKLKTLQEEPGFGKNYESVYYNTALNHAANWFLNQSETVKNGSKYVSRATALLDEILELVEQQGYGGNLPQFIYNKCKALTYNNQLEEADALCKKLFEIIHASDQRIPFFKAQKGLIKARLNQKDSALVAFNEAIKGVHSGVSELDSNYDNFKPSKTFGHTLLLSKIADKLALHFEGDEQIQRLSLKVYYLALQQLEHSFIDGKFNIKTSQYLKKIVSGILNLRRKGLGYNSNDDKDLLNRIENIRNRNEWKRFNESRYTNSLRELDSLKFKEIELRSAIVLAKQNQDQQKEDSLNNIFRIYKNQKYTKYPNLELFDSAEFSVEQLQEKLKPEDLILKYFMVENELILFTITKTDIKLSMVTWHQKEREQLELFIDNLKQKSYNDENDLANILIPDVKGYSNIIINPDNELFKLPFEVLKIDEKFLFEDFNIRYTSNLGFINPKLIGSKSDNSLAIYVPKYSGSDQASSIRSYGAKLVGAEEEAIVISKYFDSKIYDAPELSKYDFIETSSSAQLLHLAMHTLVNNEQPELSKLIFSSDAQNNNEDLYLEEIYGLKLSADMAVLSACNTGVGQGDMSNTLESFQRAFTFAGVPATIASLWEVPDIATKEIMINFYENLKQGQTKSVALNNAKLQFMKVHRNTKLEEPYYWAGFVLYGKNQAVTQANSNIALYLGILSITLLLLFLIKFKFSKT